MIIRSLSFALFTDDCSYNTVTWIEEINEIDSINRPQRFHIILCVIFIGKYEFVNREYDWKTIEKDRKFVYSC